ncbi:MAG: hypothetical protein AAF620_18070 [Bacteroidota bacterium]
MFEKILITLLYAPAVISSIQCSDFELRNGDNRDKLTAKNYKVTFLVRNESIIDTCISIEISTSDYVSKNDSVCNDKLPGYWKTVDKINLPSGENEVSIEVLEYQLRKDSLINIQSDTNIFISYDKVPSISKYENKELFLIMEEKNLIVENFRIFADSLYENDIIQYNPEYKRNLKLEVIEVSD